MPQSNNRHVEHELTETKSQSSNLFETILLTLVQFQRNKMNSDHPPNSIGNQQKSAETNSKSASIEQCETNFCPRVFQFVSAHKEAHFPKTNQSVAVCWNTVTVTKTMQDSEENTYLCRQQKKSGMPYIDFISIQAHRNRFYESEDSPVKGGISSTFAQTLMQELEIACRYLDCVSDSNQEIHE
ncbi:hypothetical protein ACQ4M3_20440 [Leptolyngbya sp. AN03gr2]|uniref:hypothetical protein n=1 Tax=unclassified Leptolyngbya TaxID=2650499 RepID=UPI003D31A4E9